MSSFRPLSDYPQTPMTREQTVTLLSIIQLDNLPEEFIPQVFEDLDREGGFLYKALKLRAEHHNLKLTPAAYLTVMEMCDGNIGKAMSILHSLAVGTGTDATISSTDFCHIFHSGVPVAADWEAFWDGQKIEGVNGIDVGIWERRQ